MSLYVLSGEFFLMLMKIAPEKNAAAAAGVDWTKLREMSAFEGCPLNATLNLVGLGFKDGHKD